MDETATDPAISTAAVRRRTPRTAKRLIGALALVLTLAGGGGTWWAANRFLIPHVEISDVAAYQAEQSAAGGSSEKTDTSGTVDGSTYTSDDASVTIAKHTSGSGDDTLTYYVADVTLTDATALRSAFADNQFGENITARVSEIAEDNDAVFAINGDYYGFRSDGIEIRGGVVFRDEGAREGLAFYKDGTVKVYDETTTTGNQLVAHGVWNTMSFGPAIVENGQTVDGIDDVEVDTNFGNHSIQGDQPRTAVGMIDTNHLVFVVVDGRDTGYSRGASLDELAGIMEGLGVQTAYNLDGGGSSEMWFDGEVVNRPSNGGERATSDIFYIAG